MTFVVEIPGLIGDPDVIADEIDDRLSGEFDEVIVSPVIKEEL